MHPGLIFAQSRSRLASCQRQMIVRLGGGGGAFADWQLVLAQDSSAGINWRKEFAVGLPGEGSPLDDAVYNYLTVPYGKLPRDMAKEEIVADWQDVSTAEVKGTKGFFALGCFQRCVRDTAHNIIDARWVVHPKMIGGNVGVKCGLTVRGFKDQFPDLDTDAGTTSRSDQRIVNAVASGNDDFILFSFDVGQAFAKGMTFEKLSKLTGTGCRAVRFGVPKQDLICLKQIKGFDNFNLLTETLTMLKPIYGFTDAPRAWRTQLHQVGEQWQHCQQLRAEPELYCAHECQQKRSRGPVGRAQVHNLEQHEVADTTRPIIPGEFTPANLQCLLSVRVGDVKGTAPKHVAESLLSHLNASVGQCKADCNSFLHICIQHEHSSGSVFTHQYVYVDSIQPIKSQLHSGKGAESVVDGPCHEACRSVFGAVFWTVLTRAGLAVYVHALQRRAHAPRVVGL